MVDTITLVHWLSRSSLESKTGVETTDKHSILEEEEMKLLPEEHIGAGVEIFTRPSPKASVILSTPLLT
tara:strand:+ start:180 stop:386 length:207 start_codon:yes stop_codon:yes gene_type:complete